MATEKAERATTRNTIQRALVLEAVQSLHNHPTSADVYEVVRARHPNISRATVYRNLGVLANRGKCCGLKFPTAPTATISSTSRTTTRSAAYAAACSTSTCPIRTISYRGFPMRTASPSSITRSFSTVCAPTARPVPRTDRAFFYRAERVEIIVRVR